jgi:hypothetical protein
MFHLVIIPPWAPEAPLEIKKVFRNNFKNSQFFCGGYDIIEQNQTKMIFQHLIALEELLINNPLI